MQCKHYLYTRSSGQLSTRLISRLLTALTLFSFIGFTNIAVAAKHVIMPQFGKVDMDSSHQSTRDFDTKSSNLLGFEYEAHIINDISIGGEFLLYKNKYRVGSSKYTSETMIGFFNVKKYFDTSTAFKPFIGMGPGYATVSTDEVYSLFSNTDFDGQVFKFMAGFAYDVERIGLYLEYMRIFGEVDGSRSETIDIDSSGIIGGIRIVFGQ